MRSRFFRSLLLSIIVVFAVSIPTFVSLAQSSPLPLSTLGQYAVGQRTLTLIDESRNGRELVTEVLYPAIVPMDQQAKLAEKSTGLRDAPPDTSHAPYPLIIYSHGASISRLQLPEIKYLLASHGFVVASPVHSIDSDYPYAWGVQRPLDILFVLEHFATLSTGDFVGLVDTVHTGVAGYSMGGYTAVAVSGARIDLEFNQAWCSKYPNVYPTVCISKEQADAMNAYLTKFASPNKDGKLFPPFTDKRIRAILALTTGAGPVFGERGLASATVPTFLIAGTNDLEAPYEWSAPYVYNNLGSKDRYLLTLVGGTHGFPLAGSDFLPATQHFATAFFGYYLQGRQDYAGYLSANYVDNLKSPSLVWGVYNGD